MKKELNRITKLDTFNDDFNIQNKLFKSSIIGVVISFVILILGILFKNEITSLSVLNFNVFLILILFLFFFFIFYLIFSKKKINDINKLKNNIIYYKVYIELSVLFKLLSVILFMLCYVIHPVTVSGDSMSDKLHDGDILITYGMFYTPKLDDIVIIDNEVGLIIKRVVATENDKVEYIDYSLYVNGVFIQNMDYYTYCMLLTDVSNNRLYDYVPKGYCIVLGDNRDNSYDSRNIGLINNETIIAKSLFRIF